MLGEVGRKIHAGRSRNDQVAAALRLYVVGRVRGGERGIGHARATDHRPAESEAHTPLPGYTHLQRAQPVTVGHHLLAWIEMLDRDLARFARRCQATVPSPLGSGALAGSTLGLPAPPAPARNSLDAVADRDFALDYLYAAAVSPPICRESARSCASGRARSSVSSACRRRRPTGSSMMPQKLNPDVAELARGKAGTAIGRLAGLLAVLKGLPLAYNRDLQEDKTAVFGARRDLAGALGALAVLVRGLEFDRGRLEAAVSDPLLLATDAAEALVQRRTSVPRCARAGRGPGSRRHLRAAVDRGRERPCARRPGPGRRGRGARRRPRALLGRRRVKGSAAASRSCTCRRTDGM